MKYIRFVFLFALSTFFINDALAQKSVSDTKVKIDTFTVYGNCGMCKRTIEGSLATAKGVSYGIWDQETHVMTVKYKTKKINLDQIKQIIADAGYDSDTHRAETEVYNNLHGCCQYDRPPPIETN